MYSEASNWAGYKKRQRARGNSKAGSEADPISYFEAAIKDWKLWVIERYLCGPAHKASQFDATDLLDVRREWLQDAASLG